MLQQRLMLTRTQFHHHRRQQALRVQRPSGQPLRDLFEQDPLVRHMLIDDGNAFLVDRENERVTKLPEWRHRPDERAYRFASRRQARPRFAAAGRGTDRPGLGRNTREVHPRCGPERESAGRLARRSGRHGRKPERQGSDRRIADAECHRRKHQLRRAGRAEGVNHRPSQDLVDETLVEKPHLGLRRMHVDVNSIGRQLDEQVHFGTPFFDRRHAIGLLDRMRDRSIPNDTAIDEDVLRSANRPLLGEGGDEAAHNDPRRGLVDADEVRPVAVDLVEPFVDRPGRRRLEQQAIAAAQNETDLVITQRELRDETRHLRGLGGIGLQELPPRRQVEEDLPDLDKGSSRCANFPDGHEFARFDPDLSGRELLARAGSQPETRHRGD
jgi:hypothetical protein